MIKTLLLIFALISCFRMTGQIKSPIHLAFDIQGEHQEDKTRRIRDEKGRMHFYIDGLHFATSSDSALVTIYDDKEIEDIELISISYFQKLASLERQRMIDEGTENQIIKILFNNDVFKKIYLYAEEKKNSIKRYEVTWVEEIE